MTIRKIAYLTAKPGLEKQLSAALRVLESHTRTELGCKEFTFYQALSEPTAFVLLEHFTGHDALELHMAQPYTQAFFATDLVADVRVEALHASA